VSKKEGRSPIVATTNRPVDDAVEYKSIAAGQHGAQSHTTAPPRGKMPDFGDSNANEDAGKRDAP